MKSSTIEFMRKRVHGNAKLRLYRLRGDGESLQTAATLLNGFLLMRNTDTQEGAPEYLLTIDRQRVPSLTDAIIQSAYTVGLLNESTNQEQRYDLNTMTPPILDNWRYVAGLHYRANDARPVVA